MSENAGEFFEKFGYFKKPVPLAFLGLIIK